MGDDISSVPKFSIYISHSHVDPKFSSHVFAHYVSSFSFLHMKAVDLLQHSPLTLKSPLAHSYHESHKRSGALKTGIRCCERLSPSLLQPLPSSLQSPLDFEAGRSIEERESNRAGTREGGAMGRRKQAWKRHFFYYDSFVLPSLKMTFRVRINCCKCIAKPSIIQP